jgi:ATP-dependent DNA helicase RecG
LLDPALTDQAKMFNLINVGERAGSGLPRIRTIWQKQGWQEPKIVESFHPDRTTLLLPLAANKAAAKSGGKKRRKV